MREKILIKLGQALEDAGVKAPEFFTDDIVLLQSGLDSLGFAILVAQLENELDYDPFTLMEEAVYPSTLGEFVGIYEKYAPEA
ncbi:acyl carrier protein [bacterium]|nr:acyl carrier protein [bacterium]MDB4603800.1 acyl carrier protein [bacterium]